jgi:XTP/dITP diphosphohydrolase
LTARAPAGATPAVVVATSNRGKLREIREILADLPIDLRSLDAWPAIEFPEEGDDYAANAVAKAQAVAAATGLPALADDSGLEVEGLGGAPGPRSARFGGTDLSDRARAAALLQALRNQQGAARNARFVCVAALALPEGVVRSARGECPGRILDAPQGSGGFGYDPVFEVKPGASMAQLPPEQKNAISHRARALRSLRDALLSLAGPPG